MRFVISYNSKNLCNLSVFYPLQSIREDALTKGQGQALNIYNSNYSIELIRDISQAQAILNLIRKSMIFYAHEANISLYSKNGAYTIPALNESRGDVVRSIEANDVFVVKDGEKYIAHVRCISDFNLGRTILSRFVIDKDYLNKDIYPLLINELIRYLSPQGIQELFVYVATENSSIIEALYKEMFQPYSVNDGYPYPKVCLIRRLYRNPYISH